MTLGTPYYTPTKMQIHWRSYRGAFGIKAVLLVVPLNGNESKNLGYGTTNKVAMQTLPEAIMRRG